MIRTGATPNTAVAAATAALRDSGFADPAVDAGTVTAVTATERGVRDHAVIAVGAGGDVAVDVRTEIADGTAWLSPQSTCPSYDYMREKRLAALILAKLHSME
ncbi:MAG TPA: hypothetical protein VKE22_29930 [Haliangiales bacterium]|nr:hypothetical protein [Haliangiales bacterium]